MGVHGYLSMDVHKVYAWTFIPNKQGGRAFSTCEQIQFFETA